MQNIDFVEEIMKVFANKSMTPEDRIREYDAVCQQMQEYRDELADLNFDDDGCAGGACKI